jgi:serine/threonine protein kinase/tetratricopeptide (TPR) repeat protein
MVIDAVGTDSRDSEVSPGPAGAESLTPLSPGGWGGTPDDPRVIAALEEYLEGLRADRPRRREEFLARHAEIAEALSQCLAGLDFIHEMAAKPVGPGPPQADDAADALPPRARLGDYRILREVGRGGMGIVYEAEQESLGRRVALKVLPTAAALDPRRRQRFLIEAQAAAQLHHPHIVPIFGVGCERGTHFYAMQFIDGRSMADVVQELRRGEGGPADERRSSAKVAQGRADTAAAASEAGLTQTAAPGPRVPAPDGDVPNVSARPPGPSPDAPTAAPAAIGPLPGGAAFCRDVARLGAEAADALHHAHGLGILHRDVKPANLLIDRDGSLWITDFGLARLPGDFGLTHTGDMVGTLRYMSPEQAEARGGVVDERTDIYALGLTLYELLTLRPAFGGRDHQELLRQIALDEPIAPRRLNPAVPRDLETIVLKAITKDPSCRYATARELADDLRRFLDDRPILARRPGVPERTLRWARRHKELVATSLAILALALAVSPLITASFWALARKAEVESQKRVAFVIESYPFLHRMGTSAISDASSKLGSGQADTADREWASRVLEQWMRFFGQAIDLPPKDPKSRDVIARAYSRLGFARWMLSISKATGNGPEPGLLAEAVADFRRSVELLEGLLAESPGDLTIRRHLAEAMGVVNMGCCLMSAGRIEESMSSYLRAIQLRRELVRGAGPGSTPGGRARADVDEELDDLPYLVSMVHIMATLLETRGRAAEAEGLRRQLEDDVVAVAARSTGQESESRRRKWATKLTLGQLPILDPGGRRDAMTRNRLARLLDPNNPAALNNLAYSLASVPGDPWFDPARGLALARKAVALEPNEWTYWNTLGVAAFRANDWNAAAEAFRQSITLGGGAHDQFFLAMTRWHQGDKKDAREIYDRAVAWTDKNKPDDPELRGLRAEAAALLGQLGLKPRREAGAWP